MAAVDYDIIVIGAGTSAIVFARFYLDIHPQCRLVLVERDGVVGGTWSRERVYEGFKAQASAKLAGFSDIPFIPPPDGVDQHGFFDARYMTDYLESYVDQHTYAGKTLRDRIKLNTTVTKLEKSNDIWTIHCQQSDNSSCSFTATKVVVANGGTSEPNLPHFPSEATFKGKIVHTLNWGRSNVLTDPAVTNVSILGGGKSAADMVYQAVKAGKSVSWIIRASGKGPGCFISRQGFGPYQNVVEAGLTRALCSVLFAGWGKQNWWSRFLFRTRLGMWLYGKVEDTVNRQALDYADFDGRVGAKESFKLLKPQNSAMWLLSPAGMVHHDDFWDVVSKNVDVYRGDIQDLTETSVTFTDGHSLECDALLLGTGFGEAFPFLSESQLIHLGLPHDSTQDTSPSASEWASLDTEATKDLLKQHPLLRNQPRVPENLGDISPSDTPFRLYNAIAPITDKSIIFLGFADVTNMFLASELQAIWSTAWIDGKLKLGDDDDKLKRDIAHTNAYSRLRCPTYGKKGNFFAFDLFHYVDRLLGEVGLTSHRRGKWWWNLLIDPFVMSNLKGMRDEYREKYGWDREKEE
ncbi:hypothetical protein B7463_g8740, partial [Scytalidium lignicola]